MIAHFDLVQKTEAWYRMRYGKITGTTAKGLLVDSDTLLIGLIGDHTEEFELMDDEYQSEAMEDGEENEPYARKELSQYLGIELLECGWLQSERNPLMGISPDGITKDVKISAEIKCPEKKKHAGTIFRKGIPKDNIHQCLQYFAVNDQLEEHYFCSFRFQSRKPLFVEQMLKSTPIKLMINRKEVTNTVADWAEIMNVNALKIKAQLETEVNKISF